MPNKPKPLLLPKIIHPCALVRVSTDEQAEQFSLPMQCLKIQEYAQYQMDVILPDEDIFREEGISGRPGTLKKRPGLDAAIKACLVGKYTHLIVHKLDRLGRNVGLVSSVLETLEDHGIVFVSVQDHVDASSAAGRLYITIFIAIAQWYSDNLSEETRKGKEGRKRAGLYNGALPFGMTTGEGHHAQPLPDLRPLTLVGSDGKAHETTNYAGLRQIFEKYSQGESARAIAQWLVAQGYRTTGTHGPNPFTKDTVNILLKNQFFLGELPDGNGGWVRGKHQAVIEQELWDRVQQLRERYQKNPQTIPGNTRIHVLGGGLLRCVACQEQGRSMALHVGKTSKETGSARFICRGKIQGFLCSQPSIDEALLEAQVTAFLETFTLPDDYQAKLVQLFQRERKRSALTEQADPEMQRARLEARLERQRDMYDLGDWTKERYLQTRQKVLHELALLTVKTASEEHLDVLVHLGGYVRQLQQAWQDADQGQRQILLRTLFEKLWVQGERIVAVTPMAQFAPFFQLMQEEYGWGIIEEMGTKKLFAAEDTTKCHAANSTSGPDRIRTGDLLRDRETC